MTKVDTKTMKQEYNSSGVDWLGDIPVGWDIVPTRSLFKTKKQVVGSNAEEHLLLGLTLGGVKPRDLSLGGKNPADYDNYQIFEPGELVMCLFDYDVTPRTVGYVKQKGMMTGAYTRLISRAKLEPRYYYYLFLYFDEKKELLHLCTGLRNSISKHVFWSLQNPLPPLETQKRIADFLDEKTKVVDELVVKKEKLIEFLREKRAALITCAVTKGLNPNAKLKPSGVEWLGDIPEGWNTKPFTSLFRERSVSNGSGDAQNVLSLSYGKIVDRDVETNFGLLPTSFNTYQIVEPGWIVFRLTDLQNDHKSLRTGLVAKRGIITSAYLSVEPTSEINQSYASFLLHSYDLYKVFYSMGGGVRQTIGYAELKWMPVVLPPLEVQNNLVKFLDAETTKIDKAVSLIELQIEKLKEYRSSLIYHAVTGKIKV